MASFAPDDDRGDGTDEEVDALEDVKDDQRKQSEIDATQVDVDPALFGEWPEGEIEQITSDPSSVATAQAVHEWQRQVALIRLTDACPHCDGPVKTYEADVGNDDTIEFACQHCDHGWITRA